MTKHYPYRLDKEGDEWVMCCEGQKSVRFTDRYQANAVFQQVNAAYHHGERDVKKALRDLLGAMP